MCEDFNLDSLVSARQVRPSHRIDIPGTHQNITIRMSSSNAMVTICFAVANRRERIRDVALATPHVRANGVNTVDRARFERAAGQVAEAFNLGVKAKMENTYTDRFLPAKSQRMLPR